MKNIKKIIMILCFMVIGGSIEAQPPTPNAPSSRTAASINRIPAQAPIGTATGLLLSLAGGCIAYKLRKNTKKEQE